MSNKAYTVELDKREWQIIEINGLLIGFPQDMAYEVASSKILKYPVEVLQTAAERLLKKAERRAKTESNVRKLGAASLEKK